ncbi:ribosomal protein S5 domain 2-like protein [Schizophyllum commune Loenen D]|nr:ribosomal protein S5 domain 2-like protein [Schizophyllum commune Loenen D]
MRPPSPSIPEKEFVLRTVQEGLRLDGRQPLEMRTPEITFGPELGWVECAFGQTRVVAQVDAKMVRPPPERPFDGIITIHSELSPMASTEYEIGRASEEEVVITRVLDKLIKRSEAVDRESLCVLAGDRVWHVRLTLHCLADAGNMLDCACFAAMAALKHFRRPDVEVVGDEVTIHPPSERAPVPLAINHAPYCLTFAFFGSGAPPLLDPSQLEETLALGTLSVALNAQREICVMQKMGGAPLGADEILGLVDVAVGKAKELDGLVEKRLKEDWARRHVEVR